MIDFLESVAVPIIKHSGKLIALAGASLLSSLATALYSTLVLQNMHLTFGMLIGGMFFWMWPSGLVLFAGIYNPNRENAVSSDARLLRLKEKGFDLENRFVRVFFYIFLTVWFLFPVMLLRMMILDLIPAI